MSLKQGDKVDISVHGENGTIKIFRCSILQCNGTLFAVEDQQVSTPERFFENLSYCLTHNRMYVTKVDEEQELLQWLKDLEEF